MTDLSNLTYRELQHLEEQIEERKEILRKSKDCVEGYKITFCVKFNPFTSVLNNPEDFGDYLANDVAKLIVTDFGLRQSDVSGFAVFEMDEDDKEDWKGFWENDDDN